MERREVRWERMFPDELEAAFEDCPVVYLPYGLCEPHGPVNALGLDALRAHGVVCQAARSFGGIVAPPEYWHCHESGGYGTWAHERVGDARPWLTAVPPWIFLKNLCYHIRAVDALGFHVAVKTIVQKTVPLTTSNVDSNETGAVFRPDGKGGMFPVQINY